MIHSGEGLAGVSVWGLGGQRGCHVTVELRFSFSPYRRMGGPIRAGEDGGGGGGVACLMGKHVGCQTGLSRAA